MNEDSKAEASSGNVFADLGFDDPEEEIIKAKLVREFRIAVKRRRLTQAKTAELIGVRQPDVSAIMTGKTHKFSITRLVRFLDRLDYSVDVVVRQKPKKSGIAEAA